LTNGVGEARDRWTLGTNIADSQRVEARAVDNSSGDPLTFAVFRAVALAATPASVVKFAGDSGLAEIGTALPESLGVRVFDGYGNPVAGVSVIWTVLSGGGSISGSGQTDANGIARSEWTMGGAAGVVRARAAVNTLPPVTFVAEAVVSQEQFVAVSAGETHSCAITATGSAYCWGQNGFGQPGSASPLVECTNPSYGPICTTRAIPVNGAPSLSAIAAGAEHSCGPFASGIWCWGGNRFGEMGTGVVGGQGLPPTAVAIGGLAFTSVSAGSWYTCGLTATQTAYCWGRSFDNQKGFEADTSASGLLVSPDTTPGIPRLVTDGVDTLRFAAIAPALVGDLAGHTCAIAVDNAGFCWGQNLAG
jgi:hypothetical protein